MAPGKLVWRISFASKHVFIISNKDGSCEAYPRTLLGEGGVPGAISEIAPCSRRHTQRWLCIVIDMLVLLTHIPSTGRKLPRSKRTGLRGRAWKHSLMAFRVDWRAMELLLRGILLHVNWTQTLNPWVLGAQTSPGCLFLVDLAGREWPDPGFAEALTLAIREVPHQFWQVMEGPAKHACVVFIAPGVIPVVSLWCPLKPGQQSQKRKRKEKTKANRKTTTTTTQSKPNQIKPNHTIVFFSP